MLPKLYCPLKWVSPLEKSWLYECKRWCFSILNSRWMKNWTKFFQLCAGNCAKFYFINKVTCKKCAEKCSRSQENSPQARCFFSVGLPYSLTNLLEGLWNRVIVLCHVATIKPPDNLSAVFLLSNRVFSMCPPLDNVLIGVIEMWWQELISLIQGI